MAGIEGKTQKEEGKIKKPLRARIIPSLLLVAFGFGLFLLGWATGTERLNLFGEDLATQNQNLPDDLSYSSVEQLYDLLRGSYDGNLDADSLLNGLKAGLVEAANDPYTEYLDAEAAKQFNEQLSGSFTGIGAELGTNEDKNIIIVSPLSGYPAEKAGLKPQDVIAAIDGQTTSGMRISEAVRKIRGSEGTEVKLTIVRGNDDPFELTIKRAKITIPSVESSMKEGIGYMKINQFSSDTAALARETAQRFKTGGVKAVVLDLRGNPGGFLSSGVDVSSLWLDKGKVVVQERRGGQVIRTERAEGNNILKGLPTVVLIDEGSASASEIVAGALKDSGAATLVGAKSFGKGSIQRVEDLSDGSELKVTIARWFTPGGKNIDKEGIEPDIGVNAGETDINTSRDRQKERAYEILKQRIQ